MKIFMSWRQKKQRPLECGATVAASALYGSSLSLPQSQQQLQPPARLCGVDLLGTTLNDHPQQPAFSHASYSIKRLEDMMCPLYSSDMLSCRNPNEEDSVSATTEYDMDLLIYEYALKNAILSIGTLGGESLPKMAGSQSSFSTEFNDVNGPAAGVTHSMDRVHSNKEIVKKLIPKDKSIDKVQVEMPFPCDKFVETALICETSSISSTLSCATLQEELRKKHNVAHQPVTVADYNNLIKEGSGKHKHWQCHKGKDVSEKAVDGHGMRTNNEMNLLQSIAMKKRSNKGHGEEQQYDEGIKCRSVEGVMGPRNITEMMRSRRTAQLGIEGTSSSRGVMGCSSDSASGQGTRRLSTKHTKGIMDFCSSGHGMSSMGSSASASNVVPTSDRCNIERVRGGSRPIVNSKPGVKNKAMKGDEEGDNENMNMATTHSNYGVKVASTCSHHTPLKSFLNIAVTPNHVATRLLKRLNQLGHRENEMDRGICKYQCKFYKLLALLGLKHSSRPCSHTMKRELGHPAVEEEQVKGEEDDDKTERQSMIEEERRSSSQAKTEGRLSSSFHRSHMIIKSVENWISTDDEYVVLELATTCR